MGNVFRKKGFFIIDSERLDQVRTRMYGYYLDEHGITTEQMFAGEKAPSSQCGAYVIVRRTEDAITIEQDYNGSYGLYVYERDGYFALSNSFMYLVDYLKTRYPLSIDKDYADYLLVADLSSVAYGRTMVREIRLLDRNAIVHIDLKMQSLSEEIVVPRIRKVELDSEEGIGILDRWFYRWTGMIKSITQQTSNVMADLSGGFDSRVTFMLLMLSGADMSRVDIVSINDDRHTHREDYEIASQIAEYYGIRLNDESMLHKERAPYTTKESISLVFAVSLGFNKLMNFPTAAFYEPRYRITGAAGGSIREFWSMPVDEFLALEKKRTDIFPAAVRKRYADAQERVLKSSIEAVARKYNIDDLNSSDLPSLLNLEERVRNHFARDAVETWFTNDIKITPLMDKDLNLLQMNTPDCPDKNLPVAIIMQRYCPDLLQFPYNDGRSIAPETIAKAAEISSRYPMAPKPPAEGPDQRKGFQFRGKPPVEGPDKQKGFQFQAKPSVEGPEKRNGFQFQAKPPAEGPEKRKGFQFQGIMEDGSIEAPPSDAKERMSKVYWDIYNSDAFQRDFKLYAGTEMDRKLRLQTLTRTHNPLYNVYSSIAVVRIMHAVWKSRDGHGSEGLCDRPRTPAPRTLRAERCILAGDAWLRKNIYWKLRDSLK